MTEWIAIVAFCTGAECASWTSIALPHKTQADCQRTAVQARTYFRNQGADSVLTVCIPLTRV